MIELQGNCPLCGANDLIELEKVLVSDLDDKYKKYGVDSIFRIFAGHSNLLFSECKLCGLKFFNPMVTAPESVYEQLQAHDWYYFDEKAEFEFARRFIKEADRVLEVGAGKGAFAKLISTKHYTGLEFSKTAIEIGKRAGVNIFNQLIEDHAIEAKSAYDVVCFFQVLEHVGNVREFLESVTACLKTNGLMILSVPSADTFLQNKVNAVLNMPPHHVTWWTDACLSNLADILGFEVIDIQHEILADVHVNSYIETLLYSSLTSLMGQTKALIETSLFHKFKYLLSIIGAKFIAPSLRERYMRPLGHSVTFVYRKR
ncbi:MAG: class I SAM-dependent methyltransferase [Geobacteraceae bacterium]|nr:class I SAM-dependent methyltransferase [Geobacteraceae bacterium]NTW79527.1 class I SAM-dependent methyltransferase [Geobacteraceae bacterium]